MKNKIYILSAVIFAFLAACTQPIDLKLNEGDNQKLVVDAWLTNDGKESIELTLTTDYFSSEEIPKASGANVNVEGNNKTYLFTETDEGMYEAPIDFELIVGQKYQLSVEYQGKEYIAESEMREVARVDSLSYEIYDAEISEYDIFLYAQEPEGMGDHYFFKTFKNGTATADTLRNADFATDELVDGNYIDGAFIGYGIYEIGDTVTVEMLSISKESHDYFLAILLETEFRGGPFDTPPANVPTNLSGEAKGFFIVSDVSKGMVIIE